MMISLFDKLDNVVEKGKKMLLTSIFSFSNSVFQNLLAWGLWKSGLCGKN